MHTLGDAKEILYRTVLNLRSDTEPKDTPVIFDSATKEMSWGWIFYYNNEKYRSTGEISDMWVGQGPIFFNRTSGDVRVFGSSCKLDIELRDYESELAADGGHWCLWITGPQARPEAIFQIKNALAINSAEALKLLPILPCCLFSGKRRHLEWMASKLAKFELETRVELMHGSDPAAEPFLLPEGMISPSAAQAYHQKWDIRDH